MTEYEIKKKLENKGFPQDEIEEVLNQLKQWGYINDRHFAHSFCQSRLNRYSRLRIQNDLRLKGIDKELASQVINEVYSNEEELDQCKLIARKLWEQEENQLLKKLNRKLGQSETADSAEKGEKILSEDIVSLIKQKVGRKLMNRGYAWQNITAALEEIESNIT